MPRYKVLETNAPNFQELCRLSDSFQGEVGTSGVRGKILGDLADKMNVALKNAKAFQKYTSTPQGTQSKDIKSLIAFHESQNSQKLEQYQAKLNNLVIHYRTWLSRQGAWFQDNSSGINWPKTMKPKVIYDTELSRQNMTKVTIVGDRLITADGKPLDTTNMVTAVMGPGYAIFVMSAEGNLHVNKHSVGHYHHSSLLAGSDVAGAGELSVKNGKITLLSNKSGHYLPKRNNMLQVLAMLQAKNLPLDFRVMMWKEHNEHKMFGSVEAFMQEHKLDNESIAAAVQNIKELTASAPPVPTPAPKAPVPPTPPPALPNKGAQAYNAGSKPGAPNHYGQYGPPAGNAGQKPGAAQYGVPGNNAGQKPAPNHYGNYGAVNNYSAQKPASDNYSNYGNYGQLEDPGPGQQNAPAASHYTEYSLSDIEESVQAIAFAL